MYIFIGINYLKGNFSDFVLNHCHENCLCLALSVPGRTIRCSDSRVWYMPCPALSTFMRKSESQIKYLAHRKQLNAHTQMNFICSQRRTLFLTKNAFFIYIWSFCWSHDLHQAIRIYFTLKLVSLEARRVHKFWPHFSTPAHSHWDKR